MTLLKNIAKVEACYPFRGRITEAPDGDARVIQMKDVNQEHGLDMSDLAITKLEGRTKPKWLKSGCILFMARGNRNFAAHLSEVPENTVCSPLFFHIRLESKELMPEFLAWQINQSGAQDYLKRERMGTRQMSIRRKTLEELPISIPPMETQKKIMELDRAMKAEQRIYQQLAENSNRMMQALTQDLLSGKTKLD